MSEEDADEVPLDDLAERLGLDDDESESGEEPAADESARSAPVDPPDAGEESADAPLSGIADRVRERRDRDEADEKGALDDVDVEDAAVDEESLFESMTVDGVDSESVWSDLVETDDTAGRYPGVGGSAERIGVGDEYVVETATFCKRCPFLSAPPELACEHEGTDILEVVDSEHFRVSACPMVDEDGTDPGGR